MNPMMAALQQSRDQAPVSSSGPMPGGPPAPPQGAPDLAKISASITELSAKMDKILSALSGQYTGKDQSVPEQEDDGGGSNQDNATAPTFDKRSTR